MLIKANEELRNPSIEMTPIIDMMTVVMTFTERFGCVTETENRDEY